MGRIVCVAVACAVVVSLATGCQNEEIKKLRASNLSLQEKLDEATNAQTRLIEEKGSLQGQLAASRSQITKLINENRALNEKVQALMNELAKPPETGDLPKGLVDALTRFAKENGEIVTLIGERVRFKSDILFDPGSATVSTKGRAALVKFAEIFNTEGAGLFLRVDGHTDVDPIKVTKGMYDDNWDLGFHRARAVSLILFAAGVSKDRVVMATHSMYTPIAKGNSKEAKAKNRRVEILLVPTK